MRKIRLLLPGFLFILILFTTSCSVNPTNAEITPTGLPLTATRGQTQTPSNTPTPEPVLSLPVANGTPYPASLGELTTENITNLTQLGHYGMPKSFYQVWSADQSHYYVQSTDGLRIYQLPDYELIAQTDEILSQSLSESNLSVSADGERYAYFSDKIYVKNVNGEILLEVESEHTSDSREVPFVFSPDGKTLLVSVSGENPWDASIWEIYDIDSKTKLEKFLNPQTIGLMFTPDGERVIAYETYTGYIASYLTSEWKYEFSTAFDKDFSNLSFSPDHSRIAITVGNYLRIYNFDGVVITREIKLPENVGNAQIIAFSQDSTKLAYSYYSVTSSEYIIRSVNIDTGEILDGYAGFDSNGKIAVDISPKSIENLGLTQGYEYSEDKTVISFIDGKFEKTEKSYSPLKDTNCFIEAMSENNSYAFCYDEALLKQRAILSYLYDVKNDGKMVSWSQANIKEVYFSPDEQYVAMTFYEFPGLDSSNQSIILYDLANNLPVLQKGNKYDNMTNRVTLDGPLAYSPDSTMLVYIVIKQDARDNYEVVFQFLSADKGQKTISISTSGETFSTLEFTSLAISPDNSMLAVGTEDGKITIFDIASQKILTSWQANAYGVTQIMFSPDQSSIASYSEDGYMNVWGLFQ